MDKIKNNEEKLIKNKDLNTLPICPIHNKNSEGFCQNCNIFVCSSCLFDSPNKHQNHSFISLNELALYIRNLLAKNNDYLKPSFYETPYNSIKEAKNNLIKKTESLIQKIIKETDLLINEINQRKGYIINLINESMKIEIEKININENKWKRNIKIIKEINKIRTNKDDSIINKNFCNIKKGIEILKQDIKKFSYILIDDYNTNIKIFYPIQPEDITKKEKNYLNYIDNYNYINERENNEIESKDKEYINISIDELCQIIKEMYIIENYQKKNVEYKA